MWPMSQEKPTLEELREAWKDARDEAIERGQFSFSLTVGGYYRAVSTRRTCNRCSGLPLYPEDCDQYEERPLERDEIILPLAWGSGWGCRHSWRFAVYKLDAPEPDRAPTPPVWSRWYSCSTAESDVEMWTVCGVPITGMGWHGDTERSQPRTRGALQFGERDFRKGKLVLARLANEWRELHKIDETVGEIILGEPGVMRPKTIEAVLKTLWRGLSGRACTKWLRKTIRDDRWGQSWSMFPWDMDEDGRGWPDRVQLVGHRPQGVQETDPDPVDWLVSRSAPKTRSVRPPVVPGQGGQPLAAVGIRTGRCPRRFRVGWLAVVTRSRARA